MMGSGSTVLVVGPAARTQALVSALASLQVRIQRAESPEEATPRAGSHDLIVALFRDGLRPLLAAAGQVPALIVETPVGQVIASIAAGAADALVAPLDPELFQVKVEALLRLRRSAQREGQEARRRAESAQRDAEDATRLKDQFLATISHEMRTPLTSILGWVRLLRLGKASADPAGHALESIERHARLEAQMVSDLLDVQRIASGKMSLAFRDVEVGGLMEKAAQALQGAAHDAGVALRLVLPVDEELRVFGDADRLQEIFESLLSNAVKFSHKGSQVDVQVQPSGVEVLILVRDRGRGIDADFLPHAFEPFRQQDSRISREKGGLGLGLALVRHVVEMHGGSVVAESDGSGTGARLSVTLPLRSRTSRSITPTSSPALPSPPVVRDLQGVRVLLVEDDLDTRYLVSTMLEQFGARVTSAESASEGLRALSSDRFDVMVSDISMPGEDGYSLMRKVRAGTVQPGIPAAALTANARTEDRARALAAGFHEHIAKPVDPPDLVRIIGRLAATQREK